MTVLELINALEQFPPDMPVGIDFDPKSEIELHKRTWVHSNYPYDEPDEDYVSIEYK